MSKDSEIQKISFHNCYFLIYFKLNQNESETNHKSEGENLISSQVNYSDTKEHNRTACLKGIWKFRLSISEFRKLIFVNFFQAKMF